METAAHPETSNELGFVPLNGTIPVIATQETVANKNFVELGVMMKSQFATIAQEESISDKLDKLSELREIVSRINNNKNGFIKNQLLDVQHIIAAFDDEANRKLMAIERLENEIKDGVLLTGVTVKASNLTAVWSKARETWDSKALSGYAVANPSILAFRKIGTPSVSIREVKAGV